MVNLKEKTCCFTGHRDIPRTEQKIILEKAKAVICNLYNDNGVRFFGVGGAIGFDTMIAELLFQLRATTFPDIKVILVYPFDGFTSRWNETQNQLYTDMLPQYDKVVRVANYPSKAAYLARDRRLVDGSAYCVAYCTKDTGGTAYTIDYAKKQGLIIINLT